MKESDFHSVSARLKPNGDNEEMPPGHQKECQLKKKNPMAKCQLQKKKKNKPKGQQSLEMFEKKRGRETTSKRIALILEVETLIGSIFQSPSEASKIIFYSIFSSS